MKRTRKLWLVYLRGMTIGGLVGLIGGYMVLRSVFPFPVDRVQEAQAHGAAQVLDRDGGLIAWRVDAAEQWRVPVTLEQVSPWVIRATIAAEDKRFWSHAGVDPVAVCRAVAQNLWHRRRVSGASTITMQTIRLLWPRPRTWPSKCIESFRALELETGQSKAQILSVYLNLAPYGGNVIGIEAAARRYFGKPCAELTLGEAALLAGIPQSPARHDPRQHLASALARRAYVLDRLQDLGLASPEAVRAARRTPVVLVSEPTAIEAPRFADFLLQRQRHEGGVYHTTLSPRTQRIARAVVREAAQDLAAMGIDGVAAVVIDVKTSALIAMVGNGAPQDPQTGWINAAVRLRQPGSLLKPFIYCMAYERGALTPRSVVYDVPSAWQEYEPENMDRQFFGPLCAAEALRLSRNIPAVTLLKRVGVDTLSLRLHALGLDLRGSTDHYGLSLALGTAEVRLVDVANAYACLARLGAYQPLRILADEPEPVPRQVFSAASAWLTLRSLGAAGSNAPMRPVWKTGTSWHHRDAWSVALTPRHVVAVWCGRMSGKGHPALIGARAALPIALELVGRLHDAQERSWRRPDNVRTRRVCALSGAPATPACPHTVSGEYIATVSASAPCRLHRYAHRGTQTQTAVVWPAAVSRWLKAGNVPGTTPRSSVTILSPAAGACYMQTREAAGERLMFKAKGNAGCASLFWYLDGDLIGRSVADQPLAWTLRPGYHELIAADGKGACARVQFRVECMD